MIMTEKRTIVIPGTVLGEADKKKPGTGTFRENNNIYASRLGIKVEKAGYINIIPLSGVYNPNTGDNVIGVISDCQLSSWMVDINAPYPAMLHVNQVPWKVEFGSTGQYLAVGDSIIARIGLIDESKKIELSMEDRGSRKIDAGIIIDIQPQKVPRVIGKSGSMITLLKKYSNCYIFVGQNGRIWVKGEPEKVDFINEAIRKIEKEAHTVGLTSRMEKFLKERGRNE
jgi:exosome complex component RRP4